jgi:hypothetical protein
MEPWGARTKHGEFSDVPQNSTFRRPAFCHTGNDHLKGLGRGSDTEVEFPTCGINSLEMGATDAMKSDHAEDEGNKSPCLPSKEFPCWHKEKMTPSFWRSGS